MQKKRFPVVPVAIAVIVIVAIFLLVRVFACSNVENGVMGGEEQGLSAEDEVFTPTYTYSPSVSTVGNIAVDDAVTVVNISNEGNVAPVISPDIENDLNNAIAAFSDNGQSAGFVALDLDTGVGVAYNVDSKVYGASSIKGLYGTYVCENLIETGKISLSSGCRAYDESYKVSGSASVNDLLHNMILYSSNGALGSLRDAYDSYGFNDWLANCGVDASSIHKNGEWFCWYTARDAAKMWTDAYIYLESGTETANVLGDYMSNTNVSYIRNALSGVEGDVLVRDKAGWYADVEGTEYNSMCDNGIVSVDGEDYLICIMTNAPYCESNQQKIEALAIAVFNACSDLSNKIDALVEVEEAESEGAGAVAVESATTGATAVESAA